MYRYYKILLLTIKYHNYDSMRVWNSMYSLVKSNFKFWKRDERKKSIFRTSILLQKTIKKHLFIKQFIYCTNIFYLDKKTTKFRRILSILLYTEVFYIRFVITNVTGTWKSMGWNNDGIILSFITCLPNFVVDISYAIHCL